MVDHYDEELYAKFFKIVGSADEEKRISQSKAAQMLGYSQAVVSAYKNKNYTGNIKLLEDKIKEFLKRDERRLTLIDVPTSETTTMEQIRTAITMAQDEACIAVIVGDSGTGKTTAVRQYVRESYSAVVIDIDPSFTQTILIMEIARAVGVEASGSTPVVIDRIITALQDRDAVIIIDEAEYLSDKILELLRRVIHDKAQTGMVLVGLPRLESKISGLRNDHHQLASRVGVFVRIQRLKKADAEKILSSVWNDLSKDVIDAFVKTVNGSTRTLVKLMARVHQIMALNNAPKPDAEIISTAAELLMR